MQNDNLFKLAIRKIREQHNWLRSPAVELLQISLIASHVAEPTRVDSTAELLRSSFAIVELESQAVTVYNTQLNRLRHLKIVNKLF